MFSGDEIQNIQDSVINIITNKKILVLSAVIFIIFLALSIYIYLSYIKPFIFKDFEMNSEFINKEEVSDKIIIMYFYTEWCPYCKVSRKEWDDFKLDVNKRTFDIPIIMREIDCDMYQDIAEQYNIEGYPTIKLLYKEEIYDYDARPDRLHLMQFLIGSLPDKKTQTKFTEDMIEANVLV